MEVIIEYGDGSGGYKLKYLIAPKLKMYHTGKSWPIHTQCHLYDLKSGLLLDYVTVIKHDVDEHNPEFAIKLATKKIMAQNDYFYKERRVEVWNKLEAAIKKDKLERFIRE